MTIQITKDMTILGDTLWADSNKQYITNGIFLIKNSLAKITSKKVKIEVKNDMDNSFNNLLNFTCKELIIELNINSFKKVETDEEIYTPVKRCYTNITTPNGNFNYYINEDYIKSLKQFIKAGGKLKLGINIPSKKEYLKLSSYLKPINQRLMLELNNEIVGTLAPVSNNFKEPEYIFTE